MNNDLEKRINKLESNYGFLRGDLSKLIKRVDKIIIDFNNIKKSYEKEVELRRKYENDIFYYELTHTRMIKLEDKLQAIEKSFEDLKDEKQMGNQDT